MPDFKKMYFRLAAKVADVVELLISAQKEGEEEYLTEDAPPLTIHTKNNEPKEE